MGIVFQIISCRITKNYIFKSKCEFEIFRDEYMRIVKWSASYFRQEFGVRQLVSHCQQRWVRTKLRGWLYMTDVPNHVGSNPTCMLWHTSVTANVPALLRVPVHSQYGNACTYARDNSDSFTLEISTACKRMERSVLMSCIRESRITFAIIE